MVVKLTKNDSRNIDKTAPGGKELYRLQFSLQAASPETFGYTLVGMLRSFFPQGSPLDILSVLLIS
jgi:hypothetical protein